MLHQLMGNGEHILVVDDEQIIREVTAKMLRVNNYIVSIAFDAQEALKIFKKKGEVFNLIISDYKMPNLSGFELVNKILLIRPELKGLLVSGYNIPPSEWRILREKGFRFLKKPYSMCFLLQNLKEMLVPKAV